MIELKHARLSLALHALQSGSGTPLLLLHALGGSAADWRSEPLAWSGPVYALDLSGHGHSGHVRGGGYLPELWVADADIALAHLGDDAVVVGAGIGAYVAVLLAGARPAAVRGGVLAPGAGLAGGGDEPDFSCLPLPPTASVESGALRRESRLDPAVYFADVSVRPRWYLQPLAADARSLVLLEDAAPRPAWWRALHGNAHVHVHHGSVSSALAVLAAEVGLAAQLHTAARTGSQR